MKKVYGLVWLVSVVLATALTYWITTSRATVDASANPKKDAMERIVKQYLDDHPEEVYAAVVKGMQKRRLAEEQEKQKLVVSKRAELEDDPATPYAGNPNGDVKIVMFTDYNCGYCKHSVPVIRSILEQDSNIKFITKEYPILGAGSVVAARAAIAVFAIDKSKYFAFYQKMFDTEIRSEKDILDAASSVGIPEAQLLQEMKKPSTTTALKRIQDLGSELGINGTPAFVINGRLHPGAMSKEQLLAIIQQARTKKGS